MSVGKLWPFNGLQLIALDWGAKHNQVMKELEAKLDLLDEILIPAGLADKSWRQEAQELQVQEAGNRTTAEVEL